MTEIVKSHFSNLNTDPIRNFKFLVSIQHQVPGYGVVGTQLGFTSVSGLSVSTDSIAYRTGGMNTAPQQIPGQSSFTPVTLQRGVVLGSAANWRWMSQLFSTKIGEGVGRASNTVPGGRFRAEVDIFVLEHPITAFTPGDQGGASHNAPVRVRLYNAWPSSLSYSDLNAGDNALFMEQMTLVHEGFDVHWGGKQVGPGSDAPGF